MSEMEKDIENLDEKSAPAGIYEVGYLIIPAVPEDAVSAEVEKIREILEKKGASIISEGNPEFKALTYEMKRKVGGKFEKFNNAYFGWVKFEGQSEILEDLKDELESLQTILRFIIISTVKENTLVSTKSVIRKTEGDADTESDSDDSEIAEESEVDEEMIDEEIDKTLEDLEIK